MKKQKNQSNITIAINALRTIIEIFSGPFLTTYFIKTSTESITDVSIYNIFCFIILGISSLLVGMMIKNKWKMRTFRVGVMTNFIYILTIILLREKVLEYLWLLAILYGFSTSFYYMPFNLFLSSKIKNEHRTNYEVKNQLISSIINIVIPIGLGAMITVTNYPLTAMIILVISLIQIALSFLLTPIQESKDTFKFKKAYRAIKKDKNANKMMMVEFFTGMTIHNSALITITTILIYNAFNTDFNLGMITAVSYILQVMVSLLYGRYYKNKNDKKVIIISSIIPIITLCIFLLYKSNITIILYHIAYSVFTNLVSMIRTIRLYNVSNTKNIDTDKQVEFWSIRELYFNLGRIVSFVFLLLAGMSKNDMVLNAVMLGLTSMILVLGAILKSVDKIKET